MIFHLVYVALLFGFIKRNGLFEKYGLFLPKYELKRAWFFIPLMLIGFASIYFGVTLKYSIPETLFYIISMLCVGFLEEIIFRGFLFVGMAQKNVKSAIVVSSVTFGIGHIVNLLNGQDILETILQITFAVAVGFMLVTLFYKGKSLIPCITFHGINNALSAISDEKASLRVFGTEEKELWITVSIAIVIAVVYSIAMWKCLSSETSKDGDQS
jgi:membrane protease YdiL (CAAX protease family)